MQSVDSAARVHTIKPDSGVDSDFRVSRGKPGAYRGTLPGFFSWARKLASTSLIS